MPMMENIGQPEDVESGPPSPVHCNGSASRKQCKHQGKRERMEREREEQQRRQEGEEDQDGDNQPQEPGISH